MTIFDLKIFFKNFLFVIFFSNNALAENVKVLAILPLTGEIAFLGDTIKNGISMGLSKTKGIDLKFEDDGGIPKNTVSALQKNLSTNRPTIVITATSGTSKAIAPILEKEKIPLIAIATDEEISLNRKYAVNFWVTPDEEAKVLVKEALRRNYKNIAIFSTIHEGPLSLKRKFLKENDSAIAVVHDEEVTPDLKDFKSIITKFKSKTKNKKADAIFVNIFFGQIGIFARQLRELGVDQELFSIELFEDKNEVNSSNGALVGQWYVQADDATGAFLEEFSKLHPNSPSFGASNGYDSILLIEEGINRNFKNSESLNNYLHNILNYKGASGTFSSTNDNRYSLPATVKIVTKDGFEKLAR